ncbi:serine/threonine protein kinase [Actinoplanes sp. LDG1-06]|uniref:non-specific serine/threonine protein kinase n=1 Tax=Paractinoplanes ovalisporus TaxID=2810368 RepID=A0ABS2A2C6_9ACTN|nr:serine/threonine-protein kinase [Actinoplanes ovalisporus]MBM2614008.1 serine/threonine protein kinase [Actinoplanes ovalisporus]
MDVNSDLAGAVLGERYELREPIGAGGMAVVWRAYDHVLARTVAVKIVAPEPGEEHRIRREARAAAALSHPNIAQVHDYGELTVGGRSFPYVVMELVEGGTLGERLSSGPVTPRLAMRICSEIAAALAAAHAAGLVHRDIKPANVMLGPTGAKVVDFGIAAATSPSGTGELTAEVLGTPAYLAPERLIDDAVVPASDVYALGVVLYRLLSGHSPWTSEDTTQMLTAHVYLEPAPLPPVAGVPGYVAELCERCLIKDPARRPSAREVAALLGQGAVAVDPAPPLPAAAVASRSRTRWAAAGALLVAVVGAAGWMLVPDDPDPSSPDPGAAPAIGSAIGSSPAAPATTASAATRMTTPATRQSSGTRPAATPPPSIPAARPGVTATTAPTLTAAPSATAAPTTAAPRTLSSDAGTVVATCPSAGMAEILRYTAQKPYKVESADSGPSAAPEVTFKHGKAVTTMTVTCASGRAEAAISET